jgi:hypothetical protein
MHRVGRLFTTGDILVTNWEIYDVCNERILNRIQRILYLKNKAKRMDPGHCLRVTGICQ